MKYLIILLSHFKNFPKKNGTKKYMLNFDTVQILKFWVSKVIWKSMRNLKNWVKWIYKVFILKQ